MPAATIRGGALVPIDNCYVSIPCEGCDNGLSGLGAEYASNDEFLLRFKVLPDISDTKTASYNSNDFCHANAKMNSYENQNAISQWLHFLQGPML